MYLATTTRIASAIMTSKTRNALSVNRLIRHCVPVSGPGGSLLRFAASASGSSARVTMRQTVVRQVLHASSAHRHPWVLVIRAAAQGPLLQARCALSGNTRTSPGLRRSATERVSTPKRYQGHAAHTRAPGQIASQALSGVVLAAQLVHGR